VLIKGLKLLAVRTEHFAATVAFYRDVLGLAVESENEEGVDFELPNGDRVEVFPPGPLVEGEPASAPVVGFLVDDVRQARLELAQRGAELVGPVHEGRRFDWAYLRGPDGHVHAILAPRRGPA
jgi:catechol 2,3-dioxygenase-like lactoylglutathione lyase family enzyme